MDINVKKFGKTRPPGISYVFVEDEVQLDPREVTGRFVPATERDEYWLHQPISPEEKNKMDWELQVRRAMFRNEKPITWAQWQAKPIE